MSFHFSRFADTAARDPWFFGNAIGRLLALYGLTLSQLAAEWGCSLEDMHRMRACRMPADQMQLEQIASEYKVPAAKLREVMGW